MRRKSSALARKMKQKQTQKRVREETEEETSVKKARMDEPQPGTSGQQVEGTGEEEEKKGPIRWQNEQIYQTLKYDDGEDNYLTDLDELTDDEQARVDDVESYLDDEDREEYRHNLEFHQQYQQKYGGHDSIRTIVTKHINRYKPPIPQNIVHEEMKTSEMTDEVEITYEEKGDGTETKRIKPIFVKMEPDQEYAKVEPVEEDFPWFPDSERLPKLPPDQVIGYFVDELEAEEAKWYSPEDEDDLLELENVQPEMNIESIEGELHQIASSLRQAATAYDNIAQRVKEMLPYQAYEVVQQLPATPTLIPAPLAKALAIDGPEEVVDKLIRYDHAQLSYTKLEEKYGVSRHRVQTTCLGRKRHGGSSRKYREMQSTEGETSTTRTKSIVKISTLVEPPE